MNIMNKVLIVIIFFIIIMFLIGMSMSEQCSEIGECKQCWSLMSKTVTSELCPNPEVACTAEPYQQQHNALVDLVLCGCENAADDAYSDTELNNRIRGVVLNAFGFELNVQQICEDPGMFLTKISYG